MTQTDDFDILLTVNSHGWTNCFLSVKDKKIDLAITHVFGDPYVDLINSLSTLIDGQDNVNFFWYGEPGGHKFEVQKNMTKRDWVTVSIFEFGESFHEEPKSYDLVMDFEVKLKQLVTIFYFQLKKIQLLLQDKQYAKDRAGNFSFEMFHQFERLVKPYISF